MYLLLHDLQDLHGAGLYTNAAGNALGSRILGLHYHDLHGAGLHALAAGNTQLLIDHVHAGLGVLGDGALLAGTHALAALDTGVGLCALTLCNDLDAAQIRIEFLIESGGASTDALQAGHALNIFIYRQLLHIKVPLFNLFPEYYTSIFAK